MLKEIFGSLSHVEQITQEEANELTNAAYNEYNEKSRQNHKQLCFATSQGISDTYFDFTNPTNHWQTRFPTGVG